MKEEVVYFELDNWFCGRDYPNAEPFITWMSNDLNLRFKDDKWCKENKLCVEACTIDMSVCFCVSASKSWVETNCPKLLTDEECGEFVITGYYNEKGEEITEKKYNSCKYSKFVFKPDENEYAYGRLSGLPFRKYKEKNFGVHWTDLHRDDDDEQ